MNCSVRVKRQSSNTGRRHPPVSTRHWCIFINILVHASRLVYTACNRLRDMDTKQFRSAVDELLGVIGRIVNLKAFPFLPVIYSSLFYFIERGAGYRKAVMALPAGPRSRRVTNKPDKFVKEFLACHAPFALVERDPQYQRRAFERLYPAVGLRDPFLLTLFREELDSGEMQSIVESFDAKVTAALAEIPSPQSKPDFWKALDSFVATTAGLATSLAREREVQDLILERVKKFLGVKTKK